MGRKQMDQGMFLLIFPSVLVLMKLIALAMKASILMMLLMMAVMK